MKTITATETLAKKNRLAFSFFPSPYVGETHIVPAESTAYRFFHNGCHLHYWITGKIDAPLLVLTHSEGANHHSFDGQVQALARTCRVLTWDIRGHGKSTSEQPFSLELAVDDLRAILSREGYTNALFAGASVGGLVTQLLAHRFPELVQGVALLSCTPLGTRTSAAGRFFGRVTSSLLRKLPYWFILAQLPASLSIRPEVQKYTVEAMRECGQENFSAAWQAYEDEIVEETAYRPTHPLLVALGAYDRPSWSARAQALWAQFSPDIQSVIVPGAGHAVPQDNPAYCNKMLDDFLRRCMRTDRSLVM